MNIEQQWKKLIYLTEKPIELPTTPTTNVKPKWFSVHSESDKLIISSAQGKKPACKIGQVRTISFEDFAEIYPYYSLRLAGHSVSAEVTQKTRNQVYIYSAIHYLALGNEVPNES